MRSGFRYLLYLTISAILISGVLLLLFKDDTFIFLSDNAGVLTPELAIKKAATSSKETLDNAILSDTKFLSLKNNVSKFDFDSICKTSVGESYLVSTSTQGVVSTTTQKINCALGNNSPFPLPSAKKE